MGSKATDLPDSLSVFRVIGANVIAIAIAIAKLVDASQQCTLISHSATLLQQRTPLTTSRDELLRRIR
tara:strand:+ start:586 stop:789 length:204 start_codon:yes stop_codon:yes gene_type:complete